MEAQHSFVDFGHAVQPTTVQYYQPEEHSTLLHIHKPRHFFDATREALPSSNLNSYFDIRFRIPTFDETGRLHEYGPQIEESVAKFFDTKLNSKHEAYCVSWDVDPKADVDRLAGPVVVVHAQAKPFYLLRHQDKAFTLFSSIAQLLATQAVRLEFTFADYCIQPMTEH